MRSSTAIDRAGASRHTAVSPPSPIERDSLSRLVLGLVLAAGVAVILPSLPNGPSRAAAGEASLLAATLAAATVVVHTARGAGAWLGTKLVALGLGVAILFQAGGWAN